jgi:predicted small secreted protein
MRPIRNQFAPLVFAVLLAGCSTFGFGKTLIVTGTSLQGIGSEFVQVAAVYKKGCDVDKSIPASQCNSFRAFGEKFQKSFPLTVQLWEVARSTNDKAMQGNIEEVIVDLASALSAFAIQVIPSKNK